MMCFAIQKTKRNNELQGMFFLNTLNPQGTLVTTQLYVFEKTALKQHFGCIFEIQR